MRDFSLKPENISLHWSVGGQKKGKCCEKTICWVLAEEPCAPDLARPTGISKTPDIFVGFGSKGGTLKFRRSQDPKAGQAASGSGRDTQDYSQPHRDSQGTS